MAYYRYGSGGPTSVNNRTSWGPMSSPHVVSPKAYARPLSGNFDRIINAFERSNAFEYVRSNCDAYAKEVEVESGERFVGCGDIVVNRRKSSSYERAGNLSAQTPCSEEDVAELYQERIVYSQARQLFPLQEDLADWINKTIGISYVNGENFLDVLDNGVELCQLAAVIVDKAKEAVSRGTATGPTPRIKGRCWQRAARRSFFSRDNMENFITFCRELGVHENLLFESDDLVLHNQPRQVVLCLLEVARLATRYDVEPPGLVQLEKEIALEERDSGLDSAMSGVGWQFRGSTPPPDTTIKSDPPPSPETNESHASEYQDCEGAASEHGSADSDVPLRPTNELDKRVQIVTRLMERNCNCSEGKCSKLLKVKKVGEGRYNIAGRNVFIRLLKGRHMMVRVGGGWDTLEHFLSRHDPCQVRLVSTNKHRTDITTLPLPYPPAPASDAGSDLSARSEHSLDISPVKSRTVSPAERPASSAGGKASPLHDATNVRRTSTPTKRYTRNAKQSLTLPLKSAINGELESRLNPKEKKSATPRSRKQSAPASFSTPSTPVGAARPAESRKSSVASGGVQKSRSMSLATAPGAEGKKPFCGTENLNRAVKTRPTSLASTPCAERKFVYPGNRTPGAPAKTTRSASLASTPVADQRKSFCGTDALNAYAKKTRSMSLASPVAHRPNALTRSVSGTAKSLISPSDIEESIRNSLIANAESSNKPFLHIKAKYRSPPPREVPPR